MQFPMPDHDQHSAQDEIYRSIVDALPNEARTIDVVMSLAMTLSAILIEQSKGREKRIQAAKLVCAKIVEACETCPSHDEIAANPDKYQTRH